MERDGVRFDYAFCRAKMWTSGGHCHSDMSVALGASSVRSVWANVCFMYCVEQSTKRLYICFRTYEMKTRVTEYTVDRYLNIHTL